MMHYRSLFVIIMLAILASCKTGTTRIDDFSQPLFTPAYASGFEIKGAEDKKSVLITVTNPWQGADSIVTNLLIIMKPLPTASTDRYSTATPGG